MWVASSTKMAGLGAESTMIRGCGAILRETATDETPARWKAAVVSGMFPAHVELSEVLLEVQRCFDLDQPPAFTVTKVEDAHKPTLISWRMPTCMHE